MNLVKLKDNLIVSAELINSNLDAIDTELLRLNNMAKNINELNYVTKEEFKELDDDIDDYMENRRDQGYYVEEDILSDTTYSTPDVRKLFSAAGAKKIKEYIEKIKAECVYDFQSELSKHYEGSSIVINKTVLPVYENIDDYALCDYEYHKIGNEIVATNTNDLFAIWLDENLQAKDIYELNADRFDGQLKCLFSENNGVYFSGKINSEGVIYYKGMTGYPNRPNIAVKTTGYGGLRPLALLSFNEYDYLIFRTDMFKLYVLKAMYDSGFVEVTTNIQGTASMLGIQKAVQDKVNNCYYLSTMGGAHDGAHQLIYTTDGINYAPVDLDVTKNAVDDLVVRDNYIYILQEPYGTDTCIVSIIKNDNFNFTLEKQYTYAAGAIKNLYNYNKNVIGLGWSSSETDIDVYTFTEDLNYDVSVDTITEAKSTGTSISCFENKGIFHIVTGTYDIEIKPAGQTTRSLLTALGYIVPMGGE